MKTILVALILLLGACAENKSSQKYYSDTQSCEILLNKYQNKSIEELKSLSYEYEKASIYFSDKSEFYYNLYSKESVNLEQAARCLGG